MFQIFVISSDLFFFYILQKKTCKKNTNKFCNTYIYINDLTTKITSFLFSGTDFNDFFIFGVNYPIKTKIEHGGKYFLTFFRYRFVVYCMCNVNHYDITFTCAGSILQDCSIWPDHMLSGLLNDILGNIIPRQEEQPNTPHHTSLYIVTSWNSYSCHKHFSKVPRKEMTIRLWKPYDMLLWFQFSLKSVLKTWKKFRFRNVRNLK